MSTFTSPIVSFGIVVSDIDAAVKFYTQAIGMTEVKGFNVPKEMGRASGLSDDLDFYVHVLKLEDSPHATLVKLMQFTNAESAVPENGFIHSTLGIRYLTIHVADMNAAVAQARQAGVEPIAEGPYLLPEGFPEGIYLTVVRDPDGNMIELVGPRKP